MCVWPPEESGVAGVRTCTNGAVDVVLLVWWLLAYGFYGFYGFYLLSWGACNSGNVQGTTTVMEPTQARGLQTTKAGE